MPKPDSPLWRETVSSFAREHIEPLRKTPGDIRCAVTVTCVLEGGARHAVPVIYIKEGGREAILVADSLGARSPDIALALADQFHSEGIAVYRVDELRQLDHFSCYVDAMELSAKIAGRLRNEDGSFGDYILPKVLKELESRRKQSILQDNVLAVRLPDELAKCAQTNRFIAAQKGPKPKPEVTLRGARKRKTLTSFRSPHELTVTWKKNYGPNVFRDINDSLRHKGFRYAELIQIGHYSRQMENYFGGEWWTPARYEEFKRCLKQVVREDRAAGMPTNNASSNHPPHAVAEE